MNMQIYFITKIELLYRKMSPTSLKNTFSVHWEAPSFHITLVQLDQDWIQTSCDVTNHVRKPTS